MKILHIYNDYYPPIIGGIEKHINSVCEGLKDKYQINVLVASRTHKASMEDINGIDVYKIPEFGRIQSAPICPSMPKWLKKLDSDILHFHLPCPTAVISYFLAKPKGKIIVTYHSDIIRQRWAMGIYSSLLRKFLNKALSIIATSPNYIDSSPFLKQFKNKSSPCAQGLDKCVVIPHGVDTNKFSLSEEEDSYILFVGNLRYYKGLDYLIEAMKQINSKLLIIGTGKQEKRLKKLAKRLKLESKISFLGYVPEDKLPSYYQRCSIFVLPSIYRSEAFGIAQIEAMSCGKPVVSTNLDTGVQWVNQHDTTGLIVPPKDSKALENAINKLLNNSSLRKQLGIESRIRVEKEFNKDIMLKKISQLYDTPR